MKGGFIPPFLNKEFIMSCTRPIVGYRSLEGRKDNGKWSIVFDKSKGYKDMCVELPCGRCIGCRLEKSRQWAARIENEAQMYDENCFVTLTYSEDNINKERSLNKEDVQKFIKRLRQVVKRKYGRKIRYYLCGEYGEKFARPHYHICIFNFAFVNDRVRLSNNNSVNNYYISPMLEDIWPFGFSTVGDLTFESAQYVAKYVIKKINGEIKEEHYKGKESEFALMSRKPGIGRDYYNLYKKDIFNTGKVIIKKGVEICPPIYYNMVMEKEDFDVYKKLKKERRLNAKKLDIDERSYLEKVREKNLARRKRNVDNL